MIEKILLINDLTLAITNGKPMIEQGFERFEKRNVLYGVQKSKVVDRKKVCSLSFFVSLKSSDMTGKNGKSSGRCARHSHVRDVQYRQIQGQQ